MQPMKSRSCLVLALAGSVLLSGCGDNDPASLFGGVTKDAPFEGTWRVGYPRQPATFYLIDVEGNQGTLTVEVNGQETHTHTFNYEGGNRITFPNSDGGPQEFGNYIDQELYLSVLRLENPPKQITFTEAEHTPFYPNPGDEIFGVEGLFAQMPFAIHEVEADDRIGLPFDQITWDGDIYSPQGTYKPPASGPLMYTAADLNEICNKYAFEGEIRNLAIKGRDIALRSFTLDNGMLDTRDFGKLEVKMEGTTIQDIVFRGTREQIRQLRTALEQTDNGNGNAQ